MPNDFAIEINSIATQLNDVANQLTRYGLTDEVLRLLNRCSVLLDNAVIDAYITVDADNWECHQRDLFSYVEWDKAA